MGLKKYEIITVGRDKRVRALRSWRVQDRYVNIGDVGGIVYDEKTLSQDGACWLFRGNFGFPGARIGGDSIVDVGEATLSATGAPNVDILGSSVVVGSKLLFESDQTAADAVVLTANDFEQGGYGAFIAGKPLPLFDTAQYVRPKNLFFAGGKTVTLKCKVPGYAITAVAVDRDGLIITNAPTASSGEGVTITVPAGQYFTFKMSKDPTAATTPAEAGSAQITFTGTYETKLSIIDSRLEINPANAKGTTTIRPGGTYTITSGAKYPEAAIRNSKVVINGHATANRTVRLISEFIGCNVAIDATSGDSQGIGVYSSVNNLTFTGICTTNWDVAARSMIQAYDCDNMVVSPTIFPGLAAAQTANMPFIFQGCNVPDGRFYHHAQIANTYKNIDFALAQADLGKAIASGEVLASSEVEGMYRLYSTTGSVFGALVESHDSVKSLKISTNFATIYGTTIYKDAYLSGLFDIAGTNVFGNAMKHEASNTQNVMTVQGGLTLTASQPPAPNNSPNVVSTINPIRINGGNGFTVTLPTGIQARLVFIDARGVYVTASGWLNLTANVPAANLTTYAAFITFQKPAGTAITPEDVKGVTVTTYNGCKIVNTKVTTTAIAGNVRVEDNATVIDTSVTGTGYFGGNSIIQAPSALAGKLSIEGAAYMSDNAVFAPTSAGSGSISLLEMRDNAVFAGGLLIASAINSITMADNARFLGAVRTIGNFNMQGNSFVASGGSVESGCRGLLTLKDDARIENGSITAVGCITLCGKYKQVSNNVWKGKRVIASKDAPLYDDNVKTKYDF